MSALGNTLSPALQRLGQVSVRLSVELGRTDMALKDVLALAEGSVVSLDKLTDELLDITANGQVIAHGEVIAQDGKFALRIVSLAGGEDVRPSPPASAPRGDIPKPEDVAPPKPQPPVEPSAQAPQVSPEKTPETMAEPSPAAPSTDAESEAASSTQPVTEGTPAPDAAEPDVDDLLDALDELTDDPNANTAPGEDDAI